MIRFAGADHPAVMASGDLPLGKLSMINIAGQKRDFVSEESSTPNAMGRSGGIIP